LNKGFVVEKGEHFRKESVCGTVWLHCMYSGHGISNIVNFCLLEKCLLLTEVLSEPPVIVDN